MMKTLTAGKVNRYLSWWLVALLVTTTPLFVAAESPQGVQPASLSQPLPGVLSGGNRLESSQAVQFAQLSTQVGDRVGQEVFVELSLNTTIMQSGQVAHQSRQTIERRQDRGVEILEVEQGRARRAHVMYFKSGQVRHEVASNQEQADEQSTPNAVEGRSYIVTRQGEQLQVTDQTGKIPPFDQYQLVQENMQSLGQPNPLARFLLGRTFVPGERILLPQSLAEELLGLSEPFGKVQKFELELVGTDLIDGQRCALFTATIEAKALEAGEIGLRIQGRLVVQVATCRTVVAELTGPVQMVSEEKTELGSFKYQAKGVMQLSIHSTYTNGGP